MDDNFIKAGILSVKELFKIGCFNIPHYQRAYSWTSAEIDNLFQDLQDSYAKKIQNQYLLGTITTIKNDNKYDILDGQQRLITLGLIFKYVLDSLPEKEYSLKTSCKNIIFIQKNDNNNLRVTQGRNIDRLHYRFLLLGEGQKEASHRIIKAYYKIKKYKNNLINTAFVNYILNQVFFVHVNTTSLGSAYQIFETLNDRSKGLQKIDLIRNKLFYAMKDSQTEAACSIWDKLYNQVSLITNGKTIDSHLQDIFTIYMQADLGLWIETKNLFEHIKNKLKTNKNNSEYPYELFLNIANSFDLYMDINAPGNSMGRVTTKLSKLYPNLIYDIKDISNLKIMHAILFALFSLFDKQKSTKKTTLKIIHNTIISLVNFTRRTKILGNIPVAKYGLEFNRLAKNIMSFSSLQELTKDDFFKREIINIDNANKSFIDDDLFISKLTNINIKQDKAKDILILIENNRRLVSGDISTKTKDLHAEYIYPLDSTQWNNVFINEPEYKHYANTLGNFALLDGKRDIETSNATFYKKKTFYKNSSCKTTRELSQEKNWTKKKIINRTTLLAKEVAKLTKII